MLSPSQRKKRAMIFKKSLQKRLRAKKLLKDKMPKLKVLQARAKRAARKKVIIKFKLLPSDMVSQYPTGISLSQKMSLERKLADPKIKASIKKFYKVSLRQMIKLAQQKILKQQESQT